MESPFLALSMHTIYDSIPDARCKTPYPSGPNYPQSRFHISSSRYDGPPVRRHASPRGHTPPRARARPAARSPRPAAGRLPPRGPPPRAVPHVAHVLLQSLPRRRVPRHPPPRRPRTPARTRRAPSREAARQPGRRRPAVLARRAREGERRRRERERTLSLLRAHTALVHQQDLFLGDRSRRTAHGYVHLSLLCFYYY